MAWLWWRCHLLHQRHYCTVLQHPTRQQHTPPATAPVAWLWWRQTACRRCRRCWGGGTSHCYGWVDWLVRCGEWAKRPAWEVGTGWRNATIYFFFLLTGTTSLLQLQRCTEAALARTASGTWRCCGWVDWLARRRAEEGEDACLLAWVESVKVPHPASHRHTARVAAGVCSRSRCASGRGARYLGSPALPLPCPHHQDLDNLDFFAPGRTAPLQLRRVMVRGVWAHVATCLL